MDLLPKVPWIRYFLATRSNDWMNEITCVIRRRRVLQHRSGDYMQRVTGGAEQASMEDFVRAYEDQFLVTTRDYKSRRALLRLARPYIRYRHGLNEKGILP